MSRKEADPQVRSASSMSPHRAAKSIATETDTSVPSPSSTSAIRGLTTSLISILGVQF